MADQLTEYVNTLKPRRFKSHPFYSKDGDFLTYFFSGQDSFAERVDDILTVYRHMETREVVGFKLKGVAHLLRSLGSFEFEVVNGRGEVLLSMLLMLAPYTAPAGSASADLPIYKDLAERAKSAKVNKAELEVEPTASAC